MKSDIEIANAATLSPIENIAAKIDIPKDALWNYGPTKAKVTEDFTTSLADKKDGKLILVTAISPTPAGEGKTTTTIGLGDALSQLGKKTAICLREPSLGPCFGIKGGAAGGGYSQVVPMEDINLHFTGDIHAIGAANNLLAALLDNHINWGNKLDVDPRRISWRRAVDMNDRALRNIVVSMGGLGNGFAREDGFDITVASEVMAVFCLAQNLTDLKERLGQIVVARSRNKELIRAHQLKADGAMSVLLKEAFRPNIVQTLEGNPAFVHGGPFANIAHGCNSVVATQTALKLADVVVTEAGFGADLGAEKFFNIKCRSANLKPSAAVVVATVRALKMHGGVAKGDLKTPNVEALKKGASNLKRHLSNVKKFGVPVVVAINRFASDSQEEIDCLTDMTKSFEVDSIPCTHFSDGGKGALELAQKVTSYLDSPSEFRPLYANELPLVDKIKTVAKDIYGADDVNLTKKVTTKLAQMTEEGFGHLPVCMAKTQYSFSTDPKALGAPSGFEIPIRDVRLAGGAQFVVALCGDVMTMPGLPREPAANHIKLNDKGHVEGLF